MSLREKMVAAEGDRHEIEFKRWFKKAWKRWSSSVEYGLGGDAGFPDQVLLGRSSEIIPVELKVGEYKAGIVFPRKVRPEQVIWHHELMEAGGRSFLMIGVPIVRRNDWMVYVVEGFRIRGWKGGYATSSGAAMLVKENNFTESLLEIISG